ncbi:MAG: hypothetical protein ACM3PO_01045 [Betaproteobacteria bacterium]
MKTRLLLRVIAFAVMTSCAKDPKAIIASYDHEKFLREKAKYAVEIGKDYWVQIPVLLCTKPAKEPEGKCSVVALTTKLQPDGIEQGSFGNPYYHVKLADGRTGYVDASTFVLHTTEIDLEKAAAECKRRGKPRVGMTAKQVEATCWGKPGRVDRRETARGYRTLCL